MQESNVGVERAAAPEITTAGRSVSAPGFGHNDFGSLPAGTNCEYLPIRAHDGGGSRGYLYRRGGESSVVCFMHPRADTSRYHIMDGLLARGFATFGQNTRWLNNDVSCVHEYLLLDIAAGIRLLRDRGFKKIILLGSSGGGSLFTFYQSQASTEPPNRLRDTAAGQPLDLNLLDMPLADGLVLLSAHIGQGKFLMKSLDPSVVTEGDPLSVDPELDMYDLRNGFREPPISSAFPAEFLGRYREAQRNRVARLDAVARAILAEQQTYKALLADCAFERIGAGELTLLKRRANAAKVMTIYRTDANPEGCDLSLSPSKREIGSLLGKRPDQTNYAAGGFAWIQTPQAWLSTWSGLSSRASLIDNIGSVTVPLLIVYYDGDNGITPDEAQEMLRRSGARDKSLLTIVADHYGMPIAASTSSQPRDQAKAAISGWLSDRF